MKAGQSIGSYVVESPLGQGSMGAVYRVRRASDGEPFALKILAEGVADEDALRRLSIEVRALAQVEGHPNVVPVVDVGATPTGQPFIVMALVEGGTLREAMRTGLDRERGLGLLAQVALALEHVHARGILHRDVKPENILVDAEGNARLSDFGLARLVNSPDRLTQTGELLGTPAYMAPEQVEPNRGEQGPATDVYALGVILYELLCGHRPYQGATWLQVFDAILSARLTPPSARAEGVPAPLERVCLAALEDDYSIRIPTARAFFDELQRARGEAAAPRASRSVAGVVRVVGVAAALLAVAVGVLAWRGGVDPVSDPAPASVDPPAPARPAWIAAAARGALDEALRAELLPHQELRLAAWSGDRERWDRARARSGFAPGEQEALAWELWPLVGGAPPAVVESQGHETWPRLAYAEGALASGQVALAALAFQFTPATARGQVAVRLGRARVRIAQGELDRALELVAEALKAAGRDPWLRLRCLEVGGPLARGAVGLDPGSARGRELWELAQREAPGLVGESAPRTEVDRARGDIVGGGFGGVRGRLERWVRSRSLPSGGGHTKSFLIAERAACARGLDGAAGLLSARAALLVRCANQGNDWRGARAAIELARKAAALRAGAFLPDWTRHVASLVLHDVQGARAALERLPADLQGEPLVLLGRAYAELAAVEGTPGVADDTSLLHVTRTRLRSKGVAPAALLRATARRFVKVEERFEAARAEAKRRQLSLGFNEATLALGRALKFRAQLRGLANDDLGDLPQRALAALEPLLRGIVPERPLALTLGLRDALVKNDATAIRAAEDALIAEQERVTAEVTGGATTAQLMALQLLSGIAPKRLRYVRTHALHLSSLPARALQWTRNAQFLSQGRVNEAVGRAKAIGGLLAPPRMKARRLASDGRGWHTDISALAELTHRQPDLIPIVLRLLRKQPPAKRRERLQQLRSLSGEMDKLFQLLGRALLLCDSPDPRDRRVAIMDTTSVVLFGPAPVGVGHLLRAVALAGLPARRVVEEEIAFDLLCARSERPWSRGVTLIRLLYGPQVDLDEACLDAQAAELSSWSWGELASPERKAELDRRFAQVRAYFGPKAVLSRAAALAHPLPQFELTKLLLAAGATKGVSSQLVEPWLRRIEDRPNLAAAGRVAAVRSSGLDEALRATWLAWPAGRLLQPRGAILRWEPVRDIGLEGEYPKANRWASRLPELHFGAHGLRALARRTTSPGRFPLQSVTMPFGVEELELHTLPLFRFQLELARWHFRRGRADRGLQCLERGLAASDDPLQDMANLLDWVLWRNLSTYRKLPTSKRGYIYRILFGSTERLGGLLAPAVRYKAKRQQVDLLLAMGGLREGKERRVFALAAKKRLLRDLRHAEDAWRHVRVYATLGDEAQVARGVKALERSARRRPALLDELRSIAKQDLLRPQRSPALRRLLQKKR